MKSAMRALLAISILTLSQADTAQPEEIFSSKPVWSSQSSNSGGDGIARFIDIDRDGDADFLTSAPNPRRWVLFRNDNGKVATKPMWESNETTDCDHIDVLDFNGDGWMDLAATHESHCTLYFNQSGTFSKAPDWETGITANANQIDFADFDQDGDVDMLMAAGNPINGVALFENTTGTPSKKPTLKLGHTEYSETAIFADFDSDGDLDVVAGYKAGRLVVYLNSAGALDAGIDVFDDKQSPWTQRLYWRDINQDRQPELYCAKGPWGPDGRSLQLVGQVGTATMKIAWQSSAQTAFHGFDFQDVDNDGDLDLIGADYGHGGKVSVYLSEGGKLSETPSWSIKTSGPAHEVVFADIDKDGDLDMAVGCKDQAHIFENLSVGHK